MLKVCQRFYNVTFYNRKAEVKRLNNILKKKPALTVLLGPPSSGKTALVKKVVEQVNNEGPLFHPLQINLRGTIASSPDALYSNLCRSTLTFFKKLLNTLTSSNIELKVISLF